MSNLIKLALIPALALAMSPIAAPEADAQLRTSKVLVVKEGQRLPSRGGFHCPPASDDSACGLGPDTLTAICEGRGGGMSSAPDGGVTCTVPD